MSTTASQLQEKYEEVFAEQLGEIRGIGADIELDDDARPRFFRSRPVPFPLRDKVNQELDRQLEEGEVYPVQKSDWAALLVIVKKPGGNIRICADFKVTVNRYVKRQSYPLPTTDELFSSLLKGESYTKHTARSGALQEAAVRSESVSEYLAENHGWHSSGPDRSCVLPE